MELEERKKHCFDLGYKGYKKGLQAPAQCQEWRDSIEGLKVGDYSGASDWNRGWFEAQDEDNKKRFPDLYKDEG